MRWPARGSATRDPNPAASMALLEEVLDPPLGPGYYSAARSRLDAGLPASTGFRTVLLLVSMIGLGFLVTVAAVTLRAPDPVAAAQRQELATRVEAAQEAGDAEALRVEQLRAEIAELEQEVQAPGDTTGGAPDLSSAGALAGAQAVTGPGVVVTLADAPPAEPLGETPGESPERITARDVVLVVNGLWTGGAEAVSINGHRLTSTSAIRHAGEAIIVDFRGLVLPYEIRAIGDPAGLRDELTAGVTGAYLDQLRTQLGLRADIAYEDEIQIGAASRLSTRLGQAPGQTTSEDDR